MTATPWAAPSLVQLRTEYDRAHPGRPTASDGWIGDAAHSARTSDHNPLANGLVWARDFTSTEAGAGSGELLAEHLRRSRDPRIKYVIWNGRIFAGDAGPRPWTWRTYAGSSPHRTHVHVSGRGDPHDTRPWLYARPPLPPPPQEAPDMLTPDQADQLRQALDHAAEAKVYAMAAMQTADRNEAALVQIAAALNIAHPKVAGHDGKRPFPVRLIDSCTRIERALDTEGR